MSAEASRERAGRGPNGETRLRAAAPLMAPGAVGVVAGGLVAAADAHAPTSAVVWTAAYLVVVVGVAQIALAAGQALLAEPAPGHAVIRAEAVLFNLGNAGVVGGTLGHSFVFVALGTAAIIAALAAFLLTARHARPGYALWLHRGLIGIVALGAIIGLTLSALGSNP